MHAVKQWNGDAAAFGNKQSTERRLLASLCYDYGISLASHFCLVNTNRNKFTQDGVKADVFRKSAFDLLWSTLTNLHAHAARKLVHGGQTRTLKSLASAIVSTAVSRKLANR